MTEHEWVACVDPRPMLEFLQNKASERKLRLFAVACCRCIWDSITDDCSREAVETSERYADHRANFVELEAAFLAADRLYSNPPGYEGLARWHSRDAARLAAHPEIRGLADGTAIAAAMAEAARGSDFWAKYADVQATQCVMLRDVIGNPFRPVTVDPAWLTWHGRTIPKFAHDIYDRRAFDRLPVLADALEEAGCVDAVLLEHLRAPGEHVRGCWTVDLVLGKE